MGMRKLWESKKKLDQINAPKSRGVQRNLPRSRFEESHRRITIYLEWDLYDKLQEMRVTGVSQTQVINNALRYFWQQETQ